MMKMAGHPNLLLVLGGMNISERAAVSLSMASLSCLQSYFAGPGYCIIKITPQEKTLLSNAVNVLAIRRDLKLCGGETWGEANYTNLV